MKRTHILVLGIVLVSIMIPGLVFATEPLDDQDDEMISLLDEMDAEKINTVDEGSTETDRSVTVRGKWGQGKDREADGFFGGTITRKGRVGVFVGTYNKTDEAERIRIVGILKKGYFNGKIISDEGEQRITGLYKIDVDEKTIRLQWMAPGTAGWALGRFTVDSG